MPTYLNDTSLTVDIKALFNKQKPASAENSPAKSIGTEADTDENKNVQQNVEDNISNTANTDVDWAKELDRRLTTNKQLSPESRKKDYEIRQQFWTDFYTALFGEAVAKSLLPIEQLQEDIKILGFKKQTNPLLIFFGNKYVQTALLNTGLINSNTYKAIHNAKARVLVADSEFLEANEYNILYCRNLYQRSVSEIEAYLEAQKKSLPTNVSAYSPERLDRNKRIFLQLGQTSVKAKDAKLNSLAAVYDILNIKQKNTSVNKSSEEETEDLEIDQELVDLLTESKANAFVALQYIGGSLGHEKALKALSELSSLDSKTIATATTKVLPQLTSFKISDSVADDLVDAIIDNIRKL